jgi:ribonuclease J
MGIEIVAVGGYGEVGKNMIAIRVDDEVVLCDMGIHLPNYIKYSEQDEGSVVKFSRKELIKVRAIPDDHIIDDWRKKVVAIVPGHAHLDHLGAVPFLAPRYDAPIICTPFTSEVLKTILADERIKIPNKITPIPVNSSIKISDTITIEFIHMTHSTPHTAMTMLHTPHGAILYGSDFKFDNSPTLGRKPNYEALKKAAKKGITVAMVDSLNAQVHGKTPSEAIAKQMLRDIMLGVNFKGKALIVTTFSSHIARLKSIVEFGNKLGRKVVFVGRSLAKYAQAAQDVGVYGFDNVEIIKYGRQVRRKLKEIERNKDKYVICMTGHQGEPNAVLSRIANGELRFKFEPGDAVIFSCKVIPAEINKQNRAVLEEKLKSTGVRMFMNIHVSGHGAREDIRELLTLIQAKNLIPMHSIQPMIEDFIDLAEDFGYVKGKNLFPLLTSQRITIV